MADRSSSEFQGNNASPKKTGAEIISVIKGTPKAPEPTNQVKPITIPEDQDSQLIYFKNMVGQSLRNKDRSLQERSQIANDVAEQTVAYKKRIVGLEEELAKTEELVLVDELTGLPNIRALYQDIQKKIDGRERQEMEGKIQEPLRVSIFDFDKFKNLNEAFGHITANEILKLMKIINQELRPGDQIYRLGGDEFVLVAQGGGESGILSITDRMNERMEKESSEKLKTAEIVNQDIEAPKFARMSFGTAEYQKGEDISELIARADVGLNNVKQQGRGQNFFAQLNPDGQITVRNLLSEGNSLAA